MPHSTNCNPPKSTKCLAEVRTNVWPFASYHPIPRTSTHSQPNGNLATHHYEYVEDLPNIQSPFLSRHRWYPSPVILVYLVQNPNMFLPPSLSPL